MPELVPRVDVSGWRDGGAARRREVAAAIDDGCRRVGFLEIVGHGVDRAALDAALVALDAFWALPADVKLRQAPADLMTNRGYSPPRAESLAYSLGVDAGPDTFEAFNIGPQDWPAGDPVYERERHGVFAANLWPAEVPALRPALTAYFAAAAALARRLTEIFAAALGLPEGYFAPFTDHSTDTMRCLNYHAAARPDGAAGEPARMGAHTDYGILTVLYGDRTPGLEIVGPDGAWHPVVPGPGGLLVNLGDLLAQWTNDRWRSTVHRVVLPAAESGRAARRRSIAFFHDGNYDAVVECLPTCASADDPPRYPPVVAGQHLAAKLAAPRLLRPTTAASTLGDRAAAVTGRLDQFD
ncbi:isopenicillin N synthase family oxygenase [Frankia sp. CNm7]|uniref:Isopenicillin N synthase family oxygenase n=1 Tax=Frankia nepalensis TaxID=1836974 RepID=A0A937RA12_9ACTN|nr:2-oxoglutarate and iron-dependent oxygenase domain-containing protein [Frankia nepalensis]MBL7496481.1 isopenicillin N synthase family oxygenase [Frankia nepalensis]MBL7515287.1 isopenicillin N synthase family oxygenase [Frankia nepalensis]MBL7520094.1 isopenicillin N synthase family oxygenase [Frankia nepalensis]MBL7625887.1 isopenicillin N synthase family oxygenase [Frankia nepalensis]